MKIDVNKMKLSIGHQERESGCGVHKNRKDKRTRRNPSTSDLLAELEDEDEEETQEGEPTDARD